MGLRDGSGVVCGRRSFALSWMGLLRVVCRDGRGTGVVGVGPAGVAREHTCVPLWDNDIRYSMDKSLLQ